MTKHWVIDDEPSARYPVYTRGNAGEVYPNVMTPLTGSLVGPAAEEGQVAALRGLGVLTPRDLRSGKVTTGVFGGYLYANLSMVRVACVRAPGMSAEDADEQMAGLTDAPPHRPQRGDRSLRATVVSSWRMTQRMLTADVGEVERARAAAEARRLEAPDPSSLTDAELVGVVRAFRPRFAEGMCRLLTMSGLAGAAGAGLSRLAERAGAPEAATTAMLAGLGTVESAQPAAELWALGRRVAASPALTTAFERESPPDVRRSSGDPDVATFLDELDAFVAAHGYRGPDEWELASPTWGSDPSIALAIVDRLRLAPPERDPVAAARRLADEREAVTAQVRAALPRPVRPLLDRIARSARLHSSARERAKAAVIADSEPARLAMFELADRVRDRGGPTERRDAFLVTIDELADFAVDPPAFAGLVDERRRRREYLQSRRPPFVFEGAIPDPSTWPSRSESRSVVPATTLAGQGVCSGVARGRARVVTDPAAPGSLEPGDVLVAPLTDPAWTPLFLAACAVVVEVGAQLSHAAIVARELGIPAVVGVADATAHLAGGQLIEVDGAAGTVTVL